MSTSSTSVNSHLRQPQDINSQAATRNKTFKIWGVTITVEVTSPLPAQPQPQPQQNADDDISLDFTLAPPAPPRAHDQELPPVNLPADNAQWDIQKTLTSSDVGSHSRLLIPKQQVHHITNHLSEEDNLRVFSLNGLRVKILDVDTMNEKRLKFKHLWSSGAHVFNGKWIKEFVKRRNLEEGDRIGLRYWNEPGEEGKLLFKVLQRRNTLQLC
ncbi:hypothetical protein QQ045_018914 [Rhodiola kirilowii]